MGIRANCPHGGSRRSPRMAGDCSGRGLPLPRGSGARAVAGPALRVRLPPSAGLLIARRLLTLLLTPTLDGRGRTWTVQPPGARSADVCGRSWTSSILLRIRRSGRDDRCGWLLAVRGGAIAAARLPVLASLRSGSACPRVA